MVGFKADGQERILEHVFGAKMVILLKHRTRTLGQKELHLFREIVKREFPKRLSYAKDSQITGGLAVVKLMLFSPVTNH